MKFSKSKTQQKNTTITPTTTNNNDKNVAAIFNEPLQSDMIERVRLTLKDVHVFKIPPRHSANGYRGADWNDKFWQGIVKIVERGNDHCAILLIDATNDTIFAVCPIFREGAVDRCTDSSRYFVLRVENVDGRHLFIGLAFNERNDAFDFNATLEDIKRERMIDEKCNNGNGDSILNINGPPLKDYSIKEGQKIHVAIPKRNDDDYYGSSSSPEKSKLSSPAKLGFDVKSLVFGEKSNAKNKKKSSKKSGSSSSGGFLAPSSKDTPSRIVPSTSSRGIK